MRRERINFNFKGKTSYVNVYFFNESSSGKILALHGLATQGYCFDKIAGKLNETIIAIDWYGYGDSERKLGNNDNYGAIICADWIVCVINALQKKRILEKKFSILAMSMSAIPIAISYTKLKSIEKIIFIHPAGLDTKINRTLAFALSGGVLSDNILKLVTKPFIWEMIWKYSSIKSSDERRKYIRDDVIMHKGEFEVLRRYSKSGFDIFGNMKKTHYIPHKFRKIKCPVLLVHGKDNVFYKKEYLKFAKKKINWTAIKIKDSPHNMIRTNALDLAKLINNFLKIKYI